jgi:glycosyltransferase involved in cell wall biosynthesis
MRARHPSDIGAIALQCFVDVSSLHALSWGSPRGVTRVEYNVAQEAMRQGARLVRFEPARKAFFPSELPVDFAHRQNRVDVLLGESTIVRMPFSNWRSVRKLKRLGRVISEARADDYEKLQTLRRDLAWLLAYNYEFLPAAERFELASHAHALEPGRNCQIFKYWVTVERASEARSAALAPGEQLVFTKGDKLLSLAANWATEYTDCLVELAAKDIVVVALIYDMIPLTHPSFMSDPGESERFVQYLDRVLNSSIQLATISNASQQEIIAYSVRSSNPPKEIAVAPLASRSASYPAVLTPKISEAGLDQLAFVLMTGSFEPRKNQKYLLDVWREVLRQTRAPHALVFAGGLARPEYLGELRRDAQDLGRVFFFYNVDDEELAWLYKNCVFTAFPSQAEGWGLPITEALDHGKYCLASDNPASKEAGQGLIFHASLDDRQAWVEELRTLLTDPLVLDERTRRVRENHHTRTWADVARALMDLPAGQTPP